MEDLFGQRNQFSGDFRPINPQEVVNWKLSCDSKEACYLLILNYINSILDDGGLSKKHIVKQKISVQEVLKNVVQNNFSLNRALFNFEDSADYSISADIHQLKYVVNQVLENSLLYNQDLNPTSIAVKKESQAIILEIKDKGIGLDKKEAKKVFEPFFRGMDSSKFAKGIGLGLTLCKEILKNNGAEIWLDSNGKGNGTSVFISFPNIDLEQKQMQAKRTQEVYYRTAAY